MWVKDKCDTDNKIKIKNWIFNMGNNIKRVRFLFLVFKIGNPARPSEFTRILDRFYLHCHDDRSVQRGINIFWNH